METDSKAPSGTNAPSQRLTVRCQFCNTWNRIDASKIPDGPKCGKCAKPILLERPVTLNDETFARTISESDVPVAVDFYADWCGPCKSIAPILDEVAKEYEGRLKIAKINVDENQQTPAKFGIRGIPTLMLFKNGNVEATRVGALSKSQLTAFLDSNI